VDLFILETFTYIEEILLAIDAIRSFSGMPIVASLTYAEDGRAYGDLSPAGRGAQLKNKNVQVIGANCTLVRRRCCRYCASLRRWTICGERNAERGISET